MIIRHAEKHQHGIHDRGVSADGRPSHHELTIRGWQRAGALVRLFAPPAPYPKSSLIQTPRSIFASDATRDSPSLRAMHTVQPLADHLGIAINHDFAEEEEEGLAQVAMVASSPVLIAWHHGCIVRLARKIAGREIAWPHWPDDRFDVVWVLDRGAHGAWSFSQVAQCLLPGDSSDVL